VEHLPMDFSNVTFPYTANERMAVITVKTLAAFLTTIASFAFIVYVFVESFRKSIFRNMIIRFLTYLQFCCLFSAIGNLYILHTSSTLEDDLLCYVQAIQTQFFDWAVFLWTLCIASFLLLTVVFAVPTSKKIELVYHIIVWTLSFVFTCLPFIGSSYGHSGLWCWVSTVNEMGEIWFWAAFYAPLWFIITIVALMYMTVMGYMVYRRRQWHNLTGFNDVIAREIKVITKLSGYPLIFLLVWIFPTINRIYSVVSDGQYIFIFVLLHSATSPLQVNHFKV
jgi:hypothetical protein